MARQRLESLAARGLLVVFVSLALLAAPAYGRSDGRANKPMAKGCGEGPIYGGEEVAFSHAVTYTVPVGKDSGYLVDCYVGADAFLTFVRQDGTLWIYTVTGQLGDYQ